MAELSTLLNKSNSHAPKLGGTQLSNLIYADDLMLISQTPIGLQRLLDITSQYSITNKLRINQEKSKVMCISTRKTKTMNNWFLDSRKLDVVIEYRYLGVILDSKGSFKPQCEDIKKRGLMTAVSLRNLKNKITWPSLLPIIKVIEAKMIPSITYGSEAMRGRDAEMVDGTVARALRMIFGLPRYTSPTQMRLEFGLAKEELARTGVYLKSW